MLRALIFDFDGLILDTETPLMQSWREVFARLHVPIAEAQLARLVEHEREPADAYRQLEGFLGRALDREALGRERWAREAELIARQPAMPGVKRLLRQAREAGIKTAVASNSRLDWIAPQLHRLGLASAFDSLRCRDHVERVKPDPALYLAVLDDLGVGNRETVAFEDAPDGAEAARRAGVFCVVVPNAATLGLTWGPVNLKVRSLSGLSLPQLAARLPR